MPFHTKKVASVILTGAHVAYIINIFFMYITAVIFDAIQIVRKVKVVFQRQYCCKKYPIFKFSVRFYTTVSA